MGPCVSSPGADPFRVMQYRGVAVPEPHLADAPTRRLPTESDVTLSVFFVLLLASTLLAWPLRDTGAAPAIVALRLLTVAVGVAVLLPERGFAIAAALAAAGIVAGEFTTGDRGALELVSRIAFDAVTCGALLGRAFRRGRVTFHRVLGAVSAYVLIAVAWGTGYQLVLVLRPGALQCASGPASPDDAMWLSFVTITTTGYGDVLPVARVARSLAALEALVGVLYPGILIARLVSLLQGPASHDDPGGAG